MVGNQRVGMGRGALVAAGLAIAASAAGSAMAANDRVLQEFTVSGWDGYAYAASDGTFNYCLGLSEYNSGVTVAFGIDKRARWFVSFARDTWNYKPGGTIAMTMQIDGGRVWRGDADIQNADVITIDIAEDAELKRQLRLGNQMSVRFDGPTFEFVLDGTNALFARLGQCV